MSDKILKKGMLTLLLIATLTLMATPYVMASPGEIWPTDSLGNPKSEFSVSDDVYVTGSGFSANTEIMIYVMDPHLGIAVAGSSVVTGIDGSIPVTLVWSGPLYKITYMGTTIYRLRDYEYEIRADNGDAFNVFTVTYPESHHSSSSSEPTPGPNPEPVVPELGTIVLMMAMFGALATAYLARKRIH